MQHGAQLHRHCCGSLSRVSVLRVRPFQPAGGAHSGTSTRPRVPPRTGRAALPGLQQDLRPSGAASYAECARPEALLTLPSGTAVRAAGAAAAAAACALLPLQPAAAAELSSTAAAVAASVVSIPGLVGDSPIREGFVSGFLLIFFSELGDKTFFIALLLALRQSKSAVFTGTFSALAVMTVISVALGQVLHIADEALPALGVTSNIPVDDLFAAALLIWFGIRTLQAAADAPEKAAEERGEAQESVDAISQESDLQLILSTFALVFAAEWGDKSFLATIALAAASSPVGVVTGAITGHGLATVLAVAGGGFLSQYFSERALQYTGGVLFLVFAAATLSEVFARAQGA